MAWAAHEKMKAMLTSEGLCHFNSISPTGVPFSFLSLPFSLSLSLLAGICFGVWISDRGISGSSVLLR